MSLLSLTAHFTVTVCGLSLATLALILRRQEMRAPAEGDIRVKGGLGHMMVGLLAGLSAAQL